MTTLLNSYLTLNLLVMLLALASYLTRKFAPSLRLRFQYAGLVLLVLVPLIQPLFPAPEFTKPIVKVWAGEKSFPMSAAPMAQESFMTVANVTENWRVETSSFFTGLSLLLLCMFGLSLWSIVRDLRILKRLKQGAHLLRQQGNIRVFTHPDISIPFSYWIPGTYNTFLPESMLTDTINLRISMLHEFQHHRQGDTQWLFGLMALRSLCIFNPFAHWLMREVSETQEYACDESLLTNKNVKNDDYIRCLVEVAQTAVSPAVEPVCATGFCFSRGQKILKRRIHNMLTYKKFTGRASLVSLVLLLGTLFAAIGWASRNMVQDRKITMEEARELIKSQGEFPLVVNEAVLTQLNRYLGTPEGRSFFADTLQRKKSYDKILAEKTQQYGTPVELNAIPVVESGYVNRSSNQGVRAAGIWMFIPSTARKFGMRVNEKVDERLNVTKETDAAHRYLVANKMLFNDWHLSVLAYNMGEGAVQKGIKKYNTRNAFELVENGVEGDKNYLPSVMAAMIIMRNPQLLD